MKKPQRLSIIIVLLSCLCAVSLASPLRTAYMFAPLPNYQNNHWVVSAPGWYLQGATLQAGEIQNIHMVYHPDNGMVVISIYIAGDTTGNNLTEIGQVGAMHNSDMPNPWQEDGDGDFVCRAASPAQNLAAFCPLPSN